MNAARHIGRVGLLAVAIGVGMGLSPTLAVATADGPSDSSAASRDTTRTAHRGGPAPRRGPARITPSAPTEVALAAALGDDAGTTGSPGRAVHAAASAAPAVRAGAVGSSREANDVPEGLAVTGAANVGTPETLAGASEPQQRRLDVPQPDVSPAPAAALTSPAATAGVLNQPSAGLATAGILAQPLAVLATPDPAPAATAPASGLLALADTLLSALGVTSDGISPRPDAPAHLPIQFALLALARREVDTLFITPTAPIATASASAVADSAAAAPLLAAAGVVNHQTPQPAASVEDQFSILPTWGILGALEAGIQTAVNVAQTAVRATVDAVQTAVRATVDAVQTAVSGIFSSPILVALEAGIQTVVTIVRNTVNFVGSWLSNLRHPGGIEQPGELTPTSALYSVLRDLTAVDNSNNFFLEPVLGADGTERLVVFLGGTEVGNPDTGAWTNLPSWSRWEVKDYQKDQVLDLLNGDTNQPIMLVGHSQGGMDAQNLAKYLTSGEAPGGLRYNVQAVVAFGSPQILTPSPDYQTIFLKDERDPVAALRQENVSVPDSSVFEKLASTPGSVDPFAVHGNVQTYIDIGKKFDASIKPEYADVKRIINEFTNGTAQVRIVLTWGSTPRDLDSHLTGPTSTTETDNRFHIHYLQKTFNLDNGVRAASLDRDDTTQYGPEVTTIRVKTPGDYYFYVHNYSGETGLAQSGANVVVYTGASSKVFTVSGTSSGMYWSVCVLTVKANGDVTITPINTYGDSPDDGSDTSF